LRRAIRQAILLVPRSSAAIIDERLGAIGFIFGVIADGSALMRRLPFDLTHGRAALLLDPAPQREKEEAAPSRMRGHSCVVPFLLRLLSIGRDRALRSGAV